MNIFEVQSILARITYKPGWRLSAAESMPLDAVCFTVNFNAPDACGNQELIELQNNSIHPREVLEDEQDVLRAVRELLRATEMHEMNEWIKLDGVAPFYPHERSQT